jgi:hypothetical protein
MPLKINDPLVREAYDELRAGGPRGRELCDILDERETRVRIWKAIAGGFTLNFINSIFLQPLRPGASEWERKYWVTLLGHEACHVEQRYWVDSVQQEIRAYTTQGRVGDELGIDLGFIKHAFSHLDPDSNDHQRVAYAAMQSLFAGQPAAIVYASLPLPQPTGIRAVRPAFRQLVAVARAGLYRPKAVKS